MPLSETAPADLPPKYYLHYFRYLLRFVQNKYAHILNENEWAFIHAFAQLNEDEQCLFVRFTNRRGLFFRTNKLNYSEINDIPTQIDVLLSKGFIHLFANSTSETFMSDFAEVLAIFTKTELLGHLKIQGIETRGMSALKKEGLIDFYVENWELFGLDSTGKTLYQGVIKRHYAPELLMLRFLFFGNRHADMTEFVMRDLGIRQYQSFDEDQLVAQFANRQEAEDRLRVSLAKEDFYLMQEAEIAPEDIYFWFSDWSAQYRDALSEVASPNYERLVLRVASYLERQRCLEQALSVFKLTTLPPSTERQIRILQKTKCLPEASALAEHLLGHYQNADELFFAKDFLNKIQADNQKKKVKKAITQQLHNSESITIPIEWRHQVEAGTIAYYEQQGYKAFFAENHLWRAIFGLVFWDIIFDTEALAIHHPLQRSPSDLYKPIFWEKRRNKLLNRLANLPDAETFGAFIENAFQEKFGTTNPLVDWFEGITEAIALVVEQIPVEKIGKILLEMAKNLKENTRGFPDLFVCRAGEYCLVEVKSPTDSLSAQQLFWQHFFKENEIYAKVLRVFWGSEEEREE